ncbi:MAG: DNA repair protein RecO [Candidatus Levybacteria bacterium CG_4_9_14_3_um_filter_35_16]|nr:MAG: DNA repair protein RecO [Candidatus Levybacteria bacterium CG22_combo_CG10-13_8_21_14_all_35_11]PJA91263.1 MAG: DNA repair protein RecO [Candidatus Levybacteria bacterium CG_4_9_14_3_um_filter_35_16]PJC54294.1 MAG: DNA repair protein RecO [Candidatus Levybacteria bacterium CG_4_9_14_0_2_um_filter_35_21]
MNSYKTEGIVIKRRNLGEADKILTIFTKRYGKIQVKAPGIRKINSRRSPHVELLNYSAISLYYGKNLPILIEAKTIEPFSDIKSDLKKISSAYHICELVDNLCPDNQENWDVFMLLKETLSLIIITIDPEKIIRAFEIKILVQLGFLKPISVDENFNTISFIEQILEKKLKTRQVAFC